MLKTSTPWSWPRSWRRSRPVACSISVGTWPDFAPSPKRDGATSDDVRGEVESVRTARVFAVRARRGALATVLLIACISVYVGGLLPGGGRGRKCCEAGGYDLFLTATRPFYRNPANVEQVKQVITRCALVDQKSKGIRVYSRYEGGRRPRHSLHARKRISICPESNWYTRSYALLGRG